MAVTVLNAKIVNPSSAFELFRIIRFKNADCKEVLYLSQTKH